MDPHGNAEINLSEWVIANIKSDYNNSKEFIRRIKRYDGFTNIPENNPEKYKQDVSGEKDGIKSLLYNRYYPVYHKPAPGNFNNIEKHLRHIFSYKNTSGEQLYEFVLDYLQILYSNPTQKLPVLCLASKERGTSKSTFLDLLRAIFMENIRILDSARISGQFNSHWAGKLIVAVDESLIDVEKKEVANRLKMICTNSTIPLEGKGKDVYEIPNFSKLIMCTNDENNFVKIDHEENRYCIVKVRPIRPEDLDVNMLQKMIVEIPAFLFFLQNRKLRYEKKSRLWFDEKVYETEQLLLVKEFTSNPVDRAIEEIIKNQFYFAKTLEIRINLDSIKNQAKEFYTYMDRLRIQRYLNGRGYKVENASNLCIYWGYDEQQYTQVKDRYYYIEAHKFLKIEEYLDLEAYIKDEKPPEP